MIQCETCGKRHKTEALVEKCKAKAERAAALHAKREAERERREKNLERESPHELVGRMRRYEGQPYEKIVAALKKDYPPPYNTWGVYEVVVEYATMLNWPTTLTMRVNALLEKHYLGEYLTYHPLVGPMIVGTDSD